MQTHFHDAKINKKNYICAKSPRKKEERAIFCREQRAMSKEQRAKREQAFRLRAIAQGVRRGKRFLRGVASAWNKRN
ncbi:MAG: hypothetical protein IJZ50_02240, partial [Alistipes sp.]|nr:hypothetical protein [Alistipes sp.]